MENAENNNQQPPQAAPVPQPAVAPATQEAAPRQMNIPAATPPQSAQAAQTAPSSENQGSMGSKPMKISITLPTNAYFVSGIRDFTLGIVKNMTEFSEQWAFRFQSVVDELCNNAIEHGSKPGEDIHISFINHPHESIEIVVEDSGTGKKKITAAQLQKIVEERRAPGYVPTGIRGRGLAKIVAEWTDEIHFADLPSGGIQVRVIKKLKNQEMEQEMEQVLESPTHLVLN